MEVYVESRSTVGEQKMCHMYNESRRACSPWWNSERRSCTRRDSVLYSGSRHNRRRFITRAEVAEEARIIVIERA